jgi:orotate phosphoribosyltransferase
MDFILEHFQKTGALLKGHFILSSGLHSSTYLQCALALQMPSDARAFGKMIAEKASFVDVETVASPAIGGLIIGYTVAEALNARFIWTERENGKMVLRRGFSVKKDERILIVEDVITTGGSTKECMQALQEKGAVIKAAACIIDRSGGKANIGLPQISLVSIEVPTYKPEECPLCKQKIPTVKPGSRR